MQSCLVLTRSYYVQHQARFENYLDTHKAVLNPSSQTTSKNNRNILLSKINAEMIKQCDKEIIGEQVMALQKFKADPTGFDSTQKDFAKLVDVEFSEFNAANEEPEGYQL